jgi:hypothetical protein
MQMIKNTLLTLFFYSVVVTTIAQNCSCVDTYKNKKKGTETTSGITSSNDFYSLLIQKEKNYKDLSQDIKYILLLNAASRVVLSDSITNSKGIIELQLIDNSTMVLENATCFNNPMGFGFCIAFKVIVTKEQLEIISKNPIINFSAFGILKTSFKEKSQKEQQKIVNCLLN